jgi:hypothetical protein
MPQIVTKSFYSREKKRELEEGETVTLSDEETKAHKGHLRRTTQRRVKLSRS